MENIVLSYSCVGKLPLPVPRQCVQVCVWLFSSTRVLCRAGRDNRWPYWYVLDYYFRRSFWPDLRYKSIVGAFWQIASFVLQSPFYIREKTLLSTSPHNSCQQKCLCSRDCQSLGIAVVSARRSELRALNTVWTTLVYIVEDTEGGWIPVYLLSNIDSWGNDRQYLGFLFNNLDTYGAYPWALGEFTSQT